MSGGREFQSLGAMTEKAMSPISAWCAVGVRRFETKAHPASFEEKGEGREG